MAIPLTPVSSRAVAALGYDPETKTARVQFSSGREYEYPGVEEHEFAALRDADSIGRHFNTHWRGRGTRSA